MLKKWKRTDDLLGYKPKFKVDCPYCKASMVPRYSYLFPKGELVYGMTGAGCQMAYKCPRCGYHQRFNITDDKEYIEKILAMRGGAVQHNPVSEWEQDERIKAKLEALGYWGNSK